LCTPRVYMTHSVLGMGCISVQENTVALYSFRAILQQKTNNFFIFFCLKKRKNTFFYKWVRWPRCYPGKSFGPERVRIVENVYARDANYCYCPPLGVKDDSFVCWWIKTVTFCAQNFRFYHNNYYQKLISFGFFFFFNALAEPLYGTYRGNHSSKDPKNLSVVLRDFLLVNYYYCSHHCRYTKKRKNRKLSRSGLKSRLHELIYSPSGVDTESKYPVIFVGISEEVGSFYIFSFLLD